MMKVAIQGEIGSNSHMAALKMSEGETIEIISCHASADVFEQLAGGSVDVAVLPIENSLHGSVFEHYDLLLENSVSVVGELLLHIRHNVIAAPEVKLEDLRQVLSHPVALSQCRKWLRSHPHIEAIASYDTAGSVKRLMAEGRRDMAGIAPLLAAEQYGAQVLVAGIEDHAENYTRFYRLASEVLPYAPDANKMSLAFSLEHKPGTLLEALEGLRRAGVNLTKIESRPVPGRPWEYVFFLDLRFTEGTPMDVTLDELRRHCVMVRELGRYRAAEIVSKIEGSGIAPQL